MVRGRQERRLRSPTSKLATRYITRFALSGRIHRMHGVLTHNGYFYVENPKDFGGESVIPPDYVFETFEAARKHAEAQRTRKLRAVRKELKRIETMTWREPKRTQAKL